MTYFGFGPSVEDLPWLALPPAARLLTPADVRARVADLPPAGRIRLFPAEHTRMAALMIPVLAVRGEAGVVVTRRSATLDHADDWVFPGGGLDPADRSPADTARRETAEELGVTLDAVQVMGRLSTRGPILNGYLIDVFVGMLAEGAELRPDPTEVAEAVALPLSWFTADGAYEKRMMLTDHPLAATAVQALSEMADPPPLGPFGAFTIRPGQWLWGMQADVLCELLMHLYSRPMKE